MKNNIEKSMRYLIEVVQQLSLARNIDTITQIVRHAARQLTGADGATFVLRENDCCYYVDEEAISPLWKGQRFPMKICISGWVMQNKQAVLIEDIYQDPRIPADAYRPTFVKSMAMVPIRQDNPIGAIGNYWAKPYKATETEMQLLQALADSTSITLENVQLYNELEQKVKDRTQELEDANKELEALSYSASHDLRAPLRWIEGFITILSDEYKNNFDVKAQSYLSKINTSLKNMNDIIEDLLALSQSTHKDLDITDVNITQLANEIISILKNKDPNRNVTVTIQDNLHVEGDFGLLKILLENLLNNAWKYTSKKEQAFIELGTVKNPANDNKTFYLKDNGAGFDMQQATKLFHAFQRLHSSNDFPGSGIGLATVSRIVKRHNGKIWAESEKGQGTTFYFEL